MMSNQKLCIFFASTVLKLHVVVCERELEDLRLSHVFATESEMCAGIHLSCGCSGIKSHVKVDRW